jgi:hypothetical protein
MYKPELTQEEINNLIDGVESLQLNQMALAIVNYEYVGRLEVLRHKLINTTNVPAIKS